MEFVRGASTITQQLAKNLYLSPSQDPIRKLRELLIARRLEAELSKQRILEIYLNVIEWGDGIYGAEAAAREYFRTSAAAARSAGVGAARRRARQRAAAQPWPPDRAAAAASADDPGADGRRPRRRRRSEPAAPLEPIPAIPAIPAAPPGLPDLLPGEPLPTGKVPGGRGGQSRRGSSTSV